MMVETLVMTSSDAPAANSLARRAAVSLALLVGFYVIGLGLAGLLAWLPFGVYSFTGRGNLQLTWFCLASAGAILWSFRPRRDPFVKPGPLLNEAEHPELFATLRDVAARTNQAMPDEVYLVPVVNAFVTERRRVTGVGRTRMMGLGLPLLQTLSIGELRAVLAHEFGHHEGGDVALGPLVYRTHRSISRTLEAVSGSILEWPFRSYGQLFLRVSAGVSRHQEHVADAFAAKIEGSVPLGSGLRKVNAVDAVYGVFLARDVMPALAAGIVPPLADGFETFVSQPHSRKFMDTVLEQVMKGTGADPYDTHPPLAERLAALETRPSCPMPQDDRMAIRLLRISPSLEVELAEHMRPTDTPRKVVSWSDVVEQVHIPEWSRMLNARKRHLESLKFEQLPAGVNALATLARQLKETIDTGVSDEEVASRFSGVIGVAIGMALYKAGWQTHYAPGAPISMRRGDAHVEPFEIARALEEGAISTQEWLSLCRQLELPATLMGGDSRERTIRSEKTKV
jgi:Zn-dependent protease with chaperone function